MLSRFLSTVLAGAAALSWIQMSSALSLFNNKATSRRAFLLPEQKTNHGASPLILVPSLLLAGAAFDNPKAAMAYERRDVGGDNRSPEGAAMNDQAYETNNRLEREGFKLDTLEEQKALLSSAMSDFSYDNAASSSSGDKNKKKSKEVKK